LKGERRNLQQKGGKRWKGQGGRATPLSERREAKRKEKEGVGAEGKNSGRKMKERRDERVLIFVGTGPS